MKILVTIKRVEDPEIKIKVRPDGGGIVTDLMKYVVNPFDEIAVEEALRLREAQGGEVVVVSAGVADTALQIRSCLAMGADRAVHILADEPLDAWRAASALETVVREEKPDLVLLGKQAIDDDMGQVGAVLAEKLGWGQATFVSKEASLESEEEKNKVAALTIKDGRMQVVREVDGGIETLSMALPAICTTELRLNTPRYTSLPNIMKAKKKEIKQRPLAEVVQGAELKIKVLKMEPPASRQAGAMVPDVATLVQKLRQEAKVI